MKHYRATHEYVEQNIKQDSKSTDDLDNHQEAFNVICDLFFGGDTEEAGAILASDDAYTFIQFANGERYAVGYPANMDDYCYVVELDA